MSEIIGEYSPEKIIVFTVADDKNLPYALGLKASFEYFHPDITFKIYGKGFLDPIKDPEKFYKMTPLIARDLIRQYEQVIKIDADSVVCGDLSHIFQNRAIDAGSVHNNNSVDPHVSVFNIPPQLYLNAGFVVMNDRRFVDHWWKLCNQPVFNGLPYREQDLLNIMAFYGDFLVINYDSISEYWHGLISKGLWNKASLLESEEGKKVVVNIPTTGINGKESFVTKEIKVIHYAGGQGLVYPNGKMTFKKHFKPEVAAYLQKLYTPKKL